MAGRNSKEREAVKARYPRSKTWPAKVDAMNDDQVFAIFMRMQNKKENK